MLTKDLNNIQINRLLLLLTLSLFLMSSNAYKVCSDYIYSFPKYSCSKSEPVGEGSTGLVFLIEQNNKKFILKVQPNTPKAQQEVEFLKRLKENPYVVSLYEMIIIDDEMRFVIQFGDRGTLLDLIISGDTHFNTFKSIMIFYKKLAEGVKLMHDEGIIHADLKLENVVVTEDYSPLIIDFDLAVELDGQHYIRGSRRYMAPEIIRNYQQHTKPVYTKKVDLYSLGVMIFATIKNVFPIVYKPWDYEDMITQKISFEIGDPVEFKNLVSKLVCLKEDRLDDNKLNNQMVDILVKPRYEVLSQAEIYRLKANDINEMKENIVDNNSENQDSIASNSIQSNIDDTESSNVEIIIVISIILLLVTIIGLLIWFGKNTRKRILNNSFSHKFSSGIKNRAEFQTNESF